MKLQTDFSTLLYGVPIHTYLLTNHNSNQIAMPTAKMQGSILGITIHNTNRKPKLFDMTDAEQYTWKTVQGEMRDVRVHFYVDAFGIWQNSSLFQAGWHATDGAGNGNRHTISIECIMSPAYTMADRMAEDNCTRLAAYLLMQFHLPQNALFPHTYWLHVRDGAVGNRKILNTKPHPYKTLTSCRIGTSLSNRFACIISSFTLPLLLLYKTFVTIKGLPATEFM